MDQRKIGEFIAAMRKEQGLTQEELGYRLGVTNKTISRWETGKYMPDIDKLQDLSSMLKISVNELLTGERIFDTTVFMQKADENLIEALSAASLSISKTKKTIRDNICTAYSLHDMNIVALEVHENEMTMRTQSGMIRATEPYDQPNGYVEFKNVDWDFCYVYILDFTGNTGNFCGEKVFLRDFISSFTDMCFSVVDEVFGYNQTTLFGDLIIGDKAKECIIGIYHLGDMIYVEEQE